VTDERSPPRGQLERWVSFAATIIAPVTVLSAVLFYFGYVSSRAQYQYFGVDVDTIGLSTQDYVIRSPQPLLVPLLVLTLVGVGGLVLHTATRRRIGTIVADTGTDAAQALAEARRRAQRAVATGVAVVVSGVVLLFAYPYLRDWALYNLVTPLLIALGGATIAYAAHVLNLLAAHTRSGPARPDAVGALAVRGATGLLIGIVIVASIFWATATVAQWSGRGIAHYDAEHLDRFPSVILDTKERLYLTNGCRHPANPRGACIEETALPSQPGQGYRFRYRHFRLLIQGHDRMFLVPDVWSSTNSTLVVPLDGSVRIQFQFQNQPP
jgi:hypothetical protein